MTFQDAITTCFNKYATFEGRASRSEYWWFVLFLILLSATASIVSPKLSGLVSLLTIIPSIAVATRRLHDTNRSGWWQLIMFVPFIGWIVLIVFLAQESRPETAQASIAA